jgi:RNA polymerase sigma-70 factor (ECF subfamily)
MHRATATATQTTTTPATQTTTSTTTEPASPAEDRAEPGALGVESLEPFRRELTAYAYRMLGAAFEAEDAVQETFVRAWRSLDRFEGRSSLRSWLYRIATNVCLDMLSSRQRRARPMDLGPAGVADIALLGEPLPEMTWVEPMPDAQLLPEAGDPETLAITRESVRLAFVAALQRLPARQRAVLILREVLRWRAAEVAELLNTSVAAVNSALQRARATLQAAQAEQAAAEHERDPATAGDELDAAQRDLLTRYVAAFESYDVRAWCLGPGIGCRDSRLIPVRANGLPAYGQYKPAPSGDGWEPWSLQVVEISGDRITGVTFFLDTSRLFPLFGLPPRLDA